MFSACKRTRLLKLKRFLKYVKINYCYLQLAMFRLQYHNRQNDFLCQYTSHLPL
jgi:hypothetical protein